MSECSAVLAAPCRSEARYLVTSEGVGWHRCRLLACEIHLHDCLKDALTRSGGLAVSVSMTDTLSDSEITQLEDSLWP